LHLSNFYFARGIDVRENIENYFNNSILPLNLVELLLTGNMSHTYSDIAIAGVYKDVYTVSMWQDLRDILEKVKDNNELTMIEILVSLESRKDLGRPKESAAQNRADFMEVYRG
jgi:hypothetical protein